MPVKKSSFFKMPRGLRLAPTYANLVFAGDEFEIIKNAVVRDNQVCRFVRFVKLSFPKF